MKYKLAQCPKTPWEIILPKDVKSYMHKVGRHPIVYDRFKKKAFCFSCGEYFYYGYPSSEKNLPRTVHYMDKIKANDSITCPLCGHEGKAVPHTRNTSVYTMAVTGRQKEGTMYFTIIGALYTFKKEEFEELEKKEASIHLEELIRINREVQESYLNYGREWQGSEKPYVHQSIVDERPEFHPSFPASVKHGFLKHCDIDMRRAQGYYVNSIDYLIKRIALNAKRPQLEYLQKAGLDVIEQRMIYDRPTYLKPDWRKSDLPGVLRLTSQDLDKLKQWDMWNIEHIAAYKEIKKFHPKTKKRDMEDFFSFFCDIGTFVTRHEYDADLRGLDPVKTARYLEKLYEDNPPVCSQGAYGYSRDHVLREYGDYSKQLRELDYPMTDYYLYPKDFFAAHDKISTELREKMDKEEQKRKRKKQKRYKEKYLPDLQKLAWGDGKYFIRPLVDYRDFSKEGKNNTNCVTSYYDRATKGETAIFVIREKLWPDKSLATVEMKNGKIVQCRAKGNTAPDTEVRAFADKWIKEVVNAKKQKGAA